MFLSFYREWALDFVKRFSDVIVWVFFSDMVDDVDWFLTVGINPIWSWLMVLSRCHEIQLANRLLGILYVSSREVCSVVVLWRLWSLVPGDARLITWTDRCSRLPFSRRDCVKLVFVLLEMFDKVFREATGAWRFFFWEIFSSRFNFCSGHSPLQLPVPTVRTAWRRVGEHVAFEELVPFSVPWGLWGWSRHGSPLSPSPGAPPDIANPRLPSAPLSAGLGVINGKFHWLSKEPAFVFHAFSLLFY